MKTTSTTYLVLIPSYNPVGKVYDTVRGALAKRAPVWVVVDGINDGTGEGLLTMAKDHTQLQVLVLPRNQGKGAAVSYGLQQAAAAGYTHALTMDADGQHPADAIPRFMAASAQAAEAMILGTPVFYASAPAPRVKGRRVSNWWASLETLWMGIGDSLFGFRVYPGAPLLDTMLAQRWMRRFDFDPEAAVRLCWRGARTLNLPAPVRYYAPGEGGVSHLRYLRDNALLTWMHTRLFYGFVCRLPLLIARRLRGEVNRMTP